MKSLHKFLPIFLYLAACSSGDDKIKASQRGVDETMAQLRGLSDKLKLEIEVSNLQFDFVKLENAVARYETDLKVYNDVMDAIMTTLGTISSAEVAKQVIGTDSAVNKIINEAIELPKKEVLGRIGEIEAILAEKLSLVAKKENLVLQAIQEGRMKQGDAQPYAWTRKHFENKASALVETRRLLENNSKFVGQLIEAIASKYSVEVKIPVVQSPPPAQQIQLTEAEAKTSSVVSSGGATARDQSGALLSLNSSAVAVDFASKNGFDVKATKQFFDLSTKTGGRDAFARGAQQVSERILDILAHMKSEINKSAGDLELVLAIDVSGSMDDDIKDVIAKLKELVVSLDAVKRSGRNVKVGIVTFGQSSHSQNYGKNTANSFKAPLTENLIAVGNSLQEILTRWGEISHSDGPGEASYEGLGIATTLFSQARVHRKIILITDEESKEAAEGWTKIINDVELKLKANGIDTSIYTIITSG